MNTNLVVANLISSAITSHRCYLSLLLGSILTVPLVHAQNEMTLTKVDEKFVDLEQRSTGCRYIERFNRYAIKEFSDAKLQKYFTLHSSDMKECDRLNSELIGQLVSTVQSNSRDLKKLQYPLYLDIVNRVSSVTTTQERLGEAGMASLIHSSLRRSEISGVSLDPLKIEKFLRDTVSQNYSSACLQSQEELDSSAQLLVNSLDKLSDTAAANPYSVTFWKSYLHQWGYTCSTSLYYKFSQKLNSQKGFGKAQEIFDAQIAGFESVNSSNIQNQFGKVRSKLTKNHVVIFFPPLGYDIPSDRPREQLTVSEWKKRDFYSPSMKQRFESGFLQNGVKVPGVGVPFELIERVTVEDLETQQIPQSELLFMAALEKHILANSHAKFIVIGRSMGGLIAREVLSRTKNSMVRGKKVSDLVENVIFIGATPYGSVIADYKSRVDQHDPTFRQMNSFQVDIAHTFLDLQSFFLGKESHFERLIEAGRNSQNVQKMSFKNYSISKISESAQSPFNVLNAIFLKKSTKNYFEKATKSQDADYVFMHWAMYGPTEGSSPLSHASWDTSNASRVFVKNYNHLAYWNLTPEAGLNLILKSIQTAAEMGLIKN